MRQGLRVHITGIVQGVGFRPFVYNLALRHGLHGWVKNTSAGVEIEVDGDRASLDLFLRGLQTETPSLARIDGFRAEHQAARGFQRLEILHSEVLEGAFQPISPDVGLCPDCLRELFDPTDRRYRYPFINCTNCGPRFTIIKDIPYDRPQTTMAPFVMCADCQREYTDPQDRRFHAQPVACPVCGPRVTFERAGAGVVAADREAIRETCTALSRGEIVAIKGLGGFHLACDAENADAVTRLRERKLRVDKPFALMLPDLEKAGAHCWLSDLEREILLSPARPIVLLKRRESSKIAREVAPHQDQIGVMLPYTPLHHLLFSAPEAHYSALVMTSANLSEEPIATQNQEARERLSTLADAFLMHDRDIHIRCDDSVVRVFDGPPATALSGKAGEHHVPAAAIYPIRRSRGYCPFPVKLPMDTPPLLAAGSELKNTFCIAHGTYAFLSHHIGDMQNYETLRSYEQAVAHFEKLFRTAPEAIAYDLHPDYLATRYAVERATRQRLASTGVQHHHAHTAACMAEHGLDGKQPVIGLAFDGTGYGEDGAVWGGEVLIADYRSYQRRYHLEYFPLPGGDAAIRKPSRTALALLWSLGMEWEPDMHPSGAFDSRELTILQAQLEKGINTPITSSMGRLFDACAALAGARQIVNYEGQAAIEFEAVADPGEQEEYPFELDRDQVRLRGCIEAVIRDVKAGVPLPKISARFHNGLASFALEACRNIRSETGIADVVLSGGVWQNMTLLGKTVLLLKRERFTVYLHREVPANDGGLSLGQAVIAAARLRGD